MGIVVKLGHVMLDKKMSLNELAENVGITTANMSNIKTGKAGKTALPCGKFSALAYKKSL